MASTVWGGLTPSVNPKDRRSCVMASSFSSRLPLATVYDF